MAGDPRTSSNASALAAAAALLAGAVVLGPFGLAGRLVAQPAPVAMYVSVLDKDGLPVPGLTAGEFVVRENGVRREVLRVEQPVTGPIDIALLVDNTAASSEYLQDTRQGVTAFVEAMHATHFISLVTFADRPTVAVDYTHDLAKLKAGTGRLFPIQRSGSYLLDALIETSKALAKRKPERAAIIVISAEGPELGNYHHDEVLSALAAGGASLSALVLTPRTAERVSDETRHRLLVLDRGPVQSGGVRYDLISSMALTGKLKLMASQLSNQYRVVYARPESLIPPDKFEVSVTRPDLEAHGTPARRRN